MYLEREKFNEYRMYIHMTYLILLYIHICIQILIYACPYVCMSMNIRYPMYIQRPYAACSLTTCVRNG